MAYRETTSRKLIARRVRKLRRALLLTRPEFAREFGVRALQVWRWETGKQAPQLRQQRMLYAMERTAGLTAGLRKEGEEGEHV